jgi:hypothetical protein
MKKFDKLAEAAGKIERQYMSNTTAPPLASYGIEATFVGRLDSVSPQVFATRQNNSGLHADGEGLGQFGEFNAQIVVQSVSGPMRLEVAYYNSGPWNGAIWGVGLYSRISPGWQFKALQIASRVDSRTALTFPFFNREMLAIVMPTLSASSVTLIFRFANITSMFMMIATLVSLYR